MSTPRPSKASHVPHSYFRDNYELAGAARVLRAVDIDSRRVLHLTLHGIEQPEADMIVHLRPVESGTAEIRFIYLWDNKIWMAESDIDAWREDAGILVVSFMSEVRPGGQ